MPDITDNINTATDKLRQLFQPAFDSLLQQAPDSDKPSALGLVVDAIAKCANRQKDAALPAELSTSVGKIMQQYNHRWGEESALQ